MQEVNKLRQELAKSSKENDILKNSCVLCEGNRLVAYRFTEQYKTEFGLRWLLSLMNILSNTCYNYVIKTTAQYRARKEAVCNEIKEI